ncbi:MAG: ParB/RepB/Spo0J family partition protein [Lachnospiraceae bacterium]|nr:ParB/RepB/Spo0J family partition protein [Lachnospiraceae bacterium]
MAARRSGLGKGLDSLIPAQSPKAVDQTASQNQQNQKEETEPLNVRITKVEPNRSQPRKNFDEASLQELADSIKQFGVITPIIVQDRQTHYEIVAGERRWRAARMAGLKEIPVIVRQYTDTELAEIALIENIQREDLNPVEEAYAYQRLIEEFHLKQEEVAEVVSKSRTAVTNSLRLLKLSEPVLQMLSRDELSMGQARALLSINDEQKQLELAQRIVKDGLSVREVEKAVKNLNKEPKPSAPKEKDEQLEIIYKNYENSLTQTLGTRVSIVDKGKGRGKMEIEFYSADDFERIMDRITRG